MRQWVPGAVPPDRFARVLGGLYGAVCGDAMGAATEMLSRRQIVATFGWLDTFVPPDLSPFAAGRAAGQVTDDASQLLAVARAVVRSSPLTTADVVAALLDWASDEEMLRRFAGPTTRAAIERFREGADPVTVGLETAGPFRGTSDGAAMRVAPIGWMHPGDLPGALADAVTSCLPTHATQVAIAGAAAIACGVAAALEPEATVQRVVAACRWGALEGERAGLAHGRDVPAPSVAARIDLGVAIAAGCTDLAAAVTAVGDAIGAGIHTAEAVPAAVALFSAARGSPVDAIVAATNLGDDSDTVATMAGALAGTLSGVDAIPEPWRELVANANGLDLPAIARALVARTT